MKPRRWKVVMIVTDAPADEEKEEYYSKDQIEFQIEPRDLDAGITAEILEITEMEEYYNG